MTPFSSRGNRDTEVMNTGGNRVGAVGAASVADLPVHTPAPKAQGAVWSLLVGGEGARALFLGKEGPGRRKGSPWASPSPLASTYSLAWIWKVCLMGLREREREGGMEKGRERGTGRLSQHGNGDRDGDVAERLDVHPRKTVLLPSPRHRFASCS